MSSSQRGGTEEVDISSGSQYRYPPKSGNYFSTHFIMGGEKFDSPQPESFLFGENSDLNFLGTKPVPFPYPPPQANEPTKTLKALMNIRRDSVHLTKVKSEGEDGSETDDLGKYNVVFTVDSDVKMNVTIHYMCTEEVNSTGLTYTSKVPHLSSTSCHMRRGAGQVFSMPDHYLQAGDHEAELLGCLERDLLPVVIHCQSEEGDEPRQSHVTIAAVDKHTDGSFALKTLKQKLFVDGLCYLIQEIYGVERKSNDEIIDEEIDDTGAECVVCMCDSRDTIILPCRHLCLCNACADSLRYQANNCPICRAPFRALLQIRALQKTGHSATHPALAGEPQPEGVPPGYELVSLVEALNEPLVHASAAAVAHPPPLQLYVDSAVVERNAASSGGNKKRSKRRGSKDPHSAAAAGSSRDHRQRGSSDKNAASSPPPVEDPLDPEALPPAPASPPTRRVLVGSGGGSDVEIVDETVSSSRKSSGVLEKRGGSSRSLPTFQDPDCFSSASAHASQLGLDLGSGDSKDKEDTEEEKEPTTEDELLRDRDDTDTVFKDNEEDDEDDEPVIVSLGTEGMQTGSLPDTPRSAGSLRSSQESSSSANSSKQLLAGGGEGGGGGPGRSDTDSLAARKGSRPRSGRGIRTSSIAPQPDAF